MRWLLIAVAAASFAIYGHAIRTFFSREHGVDRRMTLLQVGGLIAAAVHLLSIYLYPISFYRGLVSLIVYVAGLWIFFGARAALKGFRLTLAFSHDAPTGIITTGVYARIRHPFYLAYSLTWVGGFIAVLSVWTLATSVSMIVAYVYAARLEEAKFQQSSLASEYKAYRARAGLFWPKLRSL